MTHRRACRKRGLSRPCKRWWCGPPPRVPDKSLWATRYVPTARAQKHFTPARLCCNPRALAHSCRLRKALSRACMPEAGARGSRHAGYVTWYLVLHHMAAGCRALHRATEEQWLYLRLQPRTRQGVCPLARGWWSHQGLGDWPAANAGMICGCGGEMVCGRYWAWACLKTQHTRRADCTSIRIWAGMLAGR